MSSRPGTDLALRLALLSLSTAQACSLGFDAQSRVHRQSVAAGSSAIHETISTAGTGLEPSSAECGAEGTRCHDGNCARRLWDFEDTAPMQGLALTVTGRTSVNMQIEDPPGRSDGQHALRFNVEVVPSEDDNTAYLSMYVCPGSWANVDGQRIKMWFRFDDALPTGSQVRLGVVSRDLAMQLTMLSSEQIPTNDWQVVDELITVGGMELEGISISLSMPLQTTWMGTIWLDDIGIE